MRPCTFGRSCSNLDRIKLFVYVCVRAHTCAAPVHDGNLLKRPRVDQNVNVLYSLRSPLGAHNVFACTTMCVCVNACGGTVCFLIDRASARGMQTLSEKTTQTHTKKRRKNADKINRAHKMYVSLAAGQVLGTHWCCACVRERASHSVYKVARVLHQIVPSSNCAKNS